MRSVAGVGVLVCGCNGLLGLEPTHGIDAPPDAPPPRLTVSYQLLNAVGDLQYVSIDGLTSVQLARGDEPLQTIELDAAGEHLFPYDFLSNVPQVRIVTNLPGDKVPRELVWSPTYDQRLVIPRFGRLQRAQVPDQATFQLDPGDIASLHAPTVFTTGLWTTSRLPLQRDVASPVDYAYFSGTSLDGPLGALDAEKDTIVLVNYSGTTAGVNGYGRGMASTAQESIQVPMTWQRAPSVSVKYSDRRVDVAQRLFNLMEDNLKTGGIRWTVVGGVIADRRMPSYTRVAGNGSLDGSVLFPLFTKSIEGTVSDSSPLSFVNPFDVDHLPIVVELDVFQDRLVCDSMACSSDLQSGFQVIVEATNGDAGMLMPNVGFPREVTLGGTLLDRDDLKLAITTPTVDLTFSVDGPEDDCEVRLFQINPPPPPPAPPLPPLTLIRDIVVATAATQKTLSIDAAAFTSGKQHVFSISCRVGYPGAKAGDLSQVRYPFMQSRLFAGTFTPQ
jgi:hypothetical protein